MSKRKKQQSESVETVEAVETVEVPETEQTKYRTNLLVKSSLFEKYGLNNDILYAILTKPEYSIKDAESEIKNYINSFK